MKFFQRFICQALNISTICHFVWSTSLPSSLHVSAFPSREGEAQLKKGDCVRQDDIFQRFNQSSVERFNDLSLCVVITACLYSSIRRRRSSTENCPTESWHRQMPSVTCGSTNAAEGFGIFFFFALENKTMNCFVLGHTQTCMRARTHAHTHCSVKIVVRGTRFGKTKSTCF